MKDMYYLLAKLEGPTGPDTYERKSLKPLCTVSSGTASLKTAYKRIMILN